MRVDAIGTVGSGDGDKSTGSVQNPRKKPWEENSLINSFQSLVSNIAPGNCIFTTGNDVQGAIGD